MIESAWAWICAAWATLLALPWGTFSSMVQVLVFPFTLAATIAVLVTLRLTNGQLRYTRAGFRKSVKDSAENRRAAEQSRAQASDAADRAENAARGTIDALDRVAQQIEAASMVLLRMSPPRDIRLSGGGRGVPLNERSPLPPPLRQLRPDWSLTHYDGDMYQLQNLGEASAYDVRIDHDPTLMFPQGEFYDEQIGDHEARLFMAARSLGTRDSNVTVSWRAAPDDEERQAWRYPLPAKR